MVVDMSHYVAQLIWILSNLTWAMVELFSIGSDDTPRYSRLQHHADGRLVASVILIFAFLPIVILYLVWLPLYISGRIDVGQEIAPTTTFVPLDEVVID